MKNIEKLLNDPELRRLDGSSGGLLRNSAETFIAELQRDNSVQRFSLSDTDGEKPFPHSIVRIVGWLQGFEAKGAERIDVDTPDICPGGKLQPVSPVTARLENSNACVGRKPW